jgi:predicted Rossmann fold flavoprotein
LCLTPDVLILGAGAAGLMAAIEAGKRGRRVIVLERADRPGKKILISGGGRCNFTNLHTRPENFLSANPHFAKSALARYTPADFIALVERYRIAYHEKTLGQLFCDGSSQQIVDLLLAECDAAGVRIVLNAQIRNIDCGNPAAPAAPGKFTAHTQSAAYSAAKIIVATGGLSIPKMGATGLGYEIARQFRLPIVEPRPALVPFTLGGFEHADFAELTGVSAPITVSCGPCTFREKMLFTHRGLSGPAILQISSYWRPGESVSIDWAPDRNLLDPLLRSSAGRDLAAARSAFRAHLPVRLADRLFQVAPPVAFTNHALDEYERRLHAWLFHPSGTEGFDKAEVTAGGVSTDALSAQTMECRTAPGLYFIGEVVDVTGNLGGFNFQWAWASGAAAGRAV